MSERGASVPLNPLRWFPEFWQIGQRRLIPQSRLLGLSLVVGVIAGLGAVVFYLATRTVFHVVLEMLVGYHPGGPANEPPLVLLPPSETPFHWWMLLFVPALGGLVSGFLVYTFAPEAEGHGTDSAIAAYHFKGGVIRPRVPLVKIVASAITLGTGGSGGREGPIAQIGAGFGSWLGGLLRLRPAERRLLLAAGMGAGIAAIFRAPLAGALFAAEVLYRSPDFESEVVIPAALACITAYCTFGMVFSHWTGVGWKPLFDMPASMMESTTFTDPFHLVPYLLLALFVVLLAMLYTRSFYGLTELFRRLPLPPHVKPAIGAFLAGLVGLVLFFGLGQKIRALSVLSYGYGVLQDSLHRLPSEAADLSLAVLLLAIALGKILTTGLTIGSGGSGGVFGPSMVIGGCGGGALGILLNHVFPEGYMPPTASFVIVGMAGFFAAAAKTPLSTLVMVSELTGNYNLLLPTLWVCIIAFLLSDEQSIYSSQVQSRSRSPAHQGAYIREVLSGLRVGTFITPLREVSYLHPGDRIAEVIERLSSSPAQSVPVIDPEGRFVGMVTVEEVLLASQSPHLRALLVAMDLMHPVVPLLPDDPLDRAMEQFVESDTLTLPVVESADSRRALGIVKRSDLSGAYLRQVQGTQSPSVEPEPK
ncbi:MAG TPA: chloride channel protein [Gemmataceae bacterium]|jgi:CIC family chloride channel protein